MQRPKGGALSAFKSVLAFVPPVSPIYPKKYFCAGPLCSPPSKSQAGPPWDGATSPPPAPSSVAILAHVITFHSICCFHIFLFHARHQQHSWGRRASRSGGEGLAAPRRRRRAPDRPEIGKWTVFLIVSAATAPGSAPRPPAPALLAVPSCTPRPHAHRAPGPDSCVLDSHIQPTARSAWWLSIRCVICT